MRLRYMVLVVGLASFALVGMFSPPVFSQAVSGQQESARRIKTKVEPRYSQVALQYRLKGIVRVEVTVSPDGTVTKTRLVGGNPMLASAALEAVKLWKYESNQKETVEVANFTFDYTTR
ncbi:MAG: energy transducer TonB [Candidatus Acidiferrales bacterium]